MCAHGTCVRLRAHRQHAPTRAGRMQRRPRAIPARGKTQNPCWPPRERWGGQRALHSRRPAARPARAWRARGGGLPRSPQRVQPAMERIVLLRRAGAFGWESGKRRGGHGAGPRRRRRRRSSPCRRDGPAWPPCAGAHEEGRVEGDFVVHLPQLRVDLRLVFRVGEALLHDLIGDLRLGHLGLHLLHGPLHLLHIQDLVGLLHHGG
mmetsp:Transcript_104156/g.321330  ORF Transcript_104156/g.321330 Transcript_104156/m.321330 type:complete len:206 (+) Transcript_104156:218-835(+)